MNICVVSPSYPTQKVQIFVFVDQLCKAFADRGANVTIIAPQSLTRCLVHNEPLSKLHTFLETPKGNRIELYRPYTISTGNGFLKNLTSWFFNLSVRYAFNRQKNNPDICYGHFWSSIFSLLPLAKKHNIPLYGASGEENVADYDYYSETQKQLLRQYISGLVSVSTKNKKECVSLGLISEDKVTVIPNAIDLGLFLDKDKNKCRKKLGIKEKDFVVGFLGQFIPRKGTLRLSEALDSLDDDDIKAIFIGSGIEDPTYKGIIHKGSLQHHLIPEYLTACDVFVLPTENEGCSNAIIEAMACSLPIVSTNAEFNYDILNEKNSIMVDCHSISQISSAIKYLKDNLQKRELMSEEARKTASTLSIEKRAEKIMNLFNEKN